MKQKALLFIGLIVLAGALVYKRTAESRPSINAPRVAPISAPMTAKAVGFAESGRISETVSAPPSRTGKPFAIKEIPSSYPANSASKLDSQGESSLARTSVIPMPTPSLTFDGLSNFNNIDAYQAVIIPPDVNGDVGPDHYVQVVNALVRVYNKSGDPLTPPFKLSTLFAPLNTVCSTRNDGLPVVVYDPLADRWLISQYCSAFPPFRQMIAVSKTSDPTGAWYAYEFAMPNVKINDFGKFGVWPDGYYMSTEEFTGSDYSGMGMFAFDRTKLLAGDPTASYIYFSRPSISAARRGNILPADLDGLRTPALGTPNIFAGYSADEYGEAGDAIRLFDFHADFTNPLSSTFTERPESPLTVAAFDPTSPPDRTDIAQPSPGERLDSNSDRLNYRLAYRNFGTSESLVLNQTVRVSSAEPYRAGVRVYELKRTGSAFSVAEQSTIGDNSVSRWIGSVAQDNQGNIAVGYNFGNETKEPSILYSGRLATEPAGTFRQEETLIGGTGVQKAFGWRWGDYAGLAVDPVDDCTFWQTGQYYTQASEDFSDFTWLTRIGRFKFNECTPAPRGSIEGTITNATTGAPIAGTAISVYPYTRTTATSGTYGPVNVLPGSYEITATARGFRQGAAVIPVTDGQAVVRNFALEPIAVIESTGIEFTAESCRVNRVAEPGETITVNVPLRNTGTTTAQNVKADIVAINGITNVSPTQTYGTMPPGGPVVTRSFTFTVSPTVSCGASLILPINVADGFLSLGVLQIQLASGEPRVAFSQNFDRTSQGFLPVRWMRSATNIDGLPDGPRNWRVSTARSQSGSKALFSPDLNQVGRSEILTPVFAVTTADAKLSFRNWYEFETTFLRNRLYDGSVLDIKIGNAPWQDIIAAGGAFESGGYDGPLDACCQNPLANRPGWSGRSGINQTSEFITTAVRLPPTAAGQQVQLRWQVGTDVGGLREGQYIDDLVVTDGSVCSCVQ